MEPVVVYWNGLFETRLSGNRIVAVGFIVRHKNDVKDFSQRETLLKQSVRF